MTKKAPPAHLAALSSVSDDELVSRYARACIEHGEASGATTANRWADALMALAGELRGRGRGHALLSLRDHDDPNVRLWAAAHTLDLDAMSASTLRVLVDAGGLIGFTANVTLTAWADGTIEFPT